MKEHEASSTALSVLQGYWYVATHPRFAHLVSDDAREATRWIFQATETGRKRMALVEGAWTRPLLMAMQRILMPGIALHYVFRKRCIEDEVRAAISDGVTQVVNLGAGLDTLCARLAAEHPALHFIEIDHPATNALKAEALAIDGQGNLRLLAVDFSRERLDEVLGAFDFFEAARPTMFICEGVLMYLSDADIATLFQSLRHLTGAGTRCVFTSVAPMAGPNNNTGGLLKVYLKVKGEPLTFAMEQADLPDYMAKIGVTVQTIANARTFRERYLPDAPDVTLHEGEYVVTAKLA